MATIASRFFGNGVLMWISCRARSFPKKPFRTQHKGDSMRTELYWIDGRWRGRLAIMPRPRGGDWLEDEIRSWRREGVNEIVSLLTADEMADLELGDEAHLCRREGVEYLHFPIEDRGVPNSQSAARD